MLCPQGWYLCCSAELVKAWAWLCPIDVARIRALAVPGSRREGRGDQVPAWSTGGCGHRVAVLLCGEGLDSLGAVRG